MARNVKPEVQDWREYAPLYVNGKRAKNRAYYNIFNPSEVVSRRTIDELRYGGKFENLAETRRSERIESEYGLRLQAYTRYLNKDLQHSGISNEEFKSRYIPQKDAAETQEFQSMNELLMSPNKYDRMVADQFFETLEDENDGPIEGS